MRDRRVSAFGVVDLNLGELTLRYSGIVCLSPRHRPSTTPAHGRNWLGKWRGPVTGAALAPVAPWRGSPQQTHCGRSA